MTVFVSQSFSESGNARMRTKWFGIRHLAMVSYSATDDSRSEHYSSDCLCANWSAKLAWLPPRRKPTLLFKLDYSTAITVTKSGALELALVLVAKFAPPRLLPQELQQNPAVDRKHQVMERGIGPLVLFQRGLPNSTLPIEFTRRTVGCFA